MIIEIITSGLEERTPFSRAQIPKDRVSKEKAQYKKYYEVINYS